MKRGDYMTCFTDAECAELLPQLKSAYADIAMGKHKTLVKYRDRTVSYGVADKSLLKELINELDAQCGCNKGRPSRMSPLKVRHCG